MYSKRSMKKMMFNEKYGLQKAVLSRTKTKTRRNGNKVAKKYASYCVANEMKGNEDYLSLEEYAISKSPFKIGEEVAVAQSYSDIPWQYHEEWSAKGINLNVQKDGTLKGIVELAGWNNKMYVRADAMPHRIRITEVRFERLQCISDEECLEEGICKRDDMINGNMEDVVRYTFENCFERGVFKTYSTPRDAFASLIDKISGKGTWEKNEYVYVYGIEMVD